MIAKKFQATVVLGVLNGRMKDYCDLWAIPRAINIGFVTVLRRSPISLCHLCLKGERADAAQI